MNTKLTLIIVQINTIFTSSSYLQITGILGEEVFLFLFFNTFMNIGNCLLLTVLAVFKKGPGILRLVELRVAVACCKKEDRLLIFYNDSVSSMVLVLLFCGVTMKSSKMKTEKKK